MKKIFSLIVTFCLLVSSLPQCMASAYSEPSSWAADEIEAAIANELVPYSVRRNYHAYITREQFCEMVVLAYEALSGETADVGYEEFEDTDNDEILKAANLGIVAGYGNGLFGPDDLITREQIAAMVVRMLDCAVPAVDIYDYSTHYYADSYDISDWAKPSIHFAYEHNIMYGVGDSKIAPKRNTTCEEAVLLVNRTYEKYVSYEATDNENDTKYIDDDMYYTEPDESCIDVEDGITFVNNEVIIHAKKGTPESRIENIISEYDGEIIGKIGLTDTYQIQLYDEYYYDELTGIIDELCKSSYIEHAWLNMVNEEDVCYDPNDEEWADDWDDENPSGLNWGAEAINAPDAWDYRNKMKNVNVGIIDNCFWEHNDLNYQETLFNYPDTVIKEKNFHGTHVAGIIGATFDNNLGISGICPRANLYGVSLNSEPKWTGSTMSYYTALTYLIAMKKCKVINISMGYNYAEIYAVQFNPSWTSAHNMKTSQMGQYLKVLLNVGNDFVICAAAGNCNNKICQKDSDSECGYKYVSDKGNNIGIDAKYGSVFNGIEDKEIKDRIIVVGACGNDGDGQYSYSKFSNVGDRVDVVAPGEGIYSTVKNNKYDSAKGTSQAAPHVTGLAAMLFATDGTLTGKEVKKLIVDTADTNVSGTNKKMIDAAAAIKKLLGEDKNETKREDKKTDEKPDYSIKSTDFDSNIMGVEDDLIAYDEKYYYYKGVSGNLTKEAKDGSDIKEIYNDEFGHICAIDSSYVYVLKKNGDVNKLIRIAKDGSDSITLLSDVYDVHWQDNRYLYLTLQDDDKIIYKYDRKEHNEEEYQQFEYPVVKVLDYESKDSGKRYVITYEDDFLSSLLGEVKNYYYVIDKDGNILRDCGNANLMEDYHKFKYSNYTRYAKIVVNGQGRSKQSKDVYWGEKGTSKTRKISSASGWRTTEYGIISMKKTDELYSIVLNKAEDCSEETLSVENQKKDYTLVDFDDDGNYYCARKEGEKYTVQRQRVGSVFADLLGSFRSYGANSMILKVVDDLIMVFSNDDDTEAQLIYKVSKDGEKAIMLK